MARKDEDIENKETDEDQADEDQSEDDSDQDDEDVADDDSDEGEGDDSADDDDPDDDADDSDPDEGETEKPDEDAWTRALDDDDDAPDDESEDKASINPARKAERRLRRRMAERDKRIEELERQVANKPATLRMLREPTLQDAGNDAEKFAELKVQWSKQNEEDQKFLAEQKTAQEEFLGKREAKKRRAEDLSDRIRDYDEAVETAQEYLSEAQMNIITDVAQHPERIEYLIGKKPVVAERISKLKHVGPIAYEIGKLEASMSTARKGKADKPRKPAPEKKVRSKGAAGKTGPRNSDAAKLKRLKAEAAETGDSTAYCDEFNRQEAARLKKQSGG